MGFLVNIGYKFPLPPSITPDGSIILCSAMPMHQLLRRRIDHRYPHMQSRLFDPQLYLTDLEATSAPRHCAILASYPWFGVSGLKEYDSKQQKQSEWRKYAVKTIPTVWPRQLIEDATTVRDVAKDCLEFQIKIGCWAAILPGPLSVDPATDYSQELAWLDAGIAAAREIEDFELPLFATIAVSDICLRHEEPLKNAFLDLVLDTVSAREVDGVYIVLEQASEPNNTRHCGSVRSLGSILRLAHEFSKDGDLRVGVNFIGAYGLVCESAGAEFWATGWYKSLYRLRLADKLVGGRAYPRFWSYPAAIDVHLENEFDSIVSAGLLAQIADNTSASNGLLSAAASGNPVANVPAWRYALSNVGAAREHFLVSCVQGEAMHSKQAGKARIDLAEKWLDRAAATSTAVATALGPTANTQTVHVQAWRDTLRGFRQDHNA